MARSAEPPCIQPLASFCSVSPCKSYDETRAELVADPKVAHLETGGCGNFRYLREQVFVFGRTRWFDQHGALVGAVWASDSPTRDCHGRDSYAAAYGLVPECSAIQRQALK